MASQTINRSNPSICVPRVFPNITWKRVKAVFEELGLGEVERVDMVNKTNDKGEKFKRVFVHFKHWNKNDTAKAVKAKLLSGDSVKVVYDDPWFWKVFMSNAPKPQWEKRERKPAAGNKKKRTKPRLATDEHPGAPTPAKAASELAQLKAMMAAQREEMERMRQQMAEMKTSDGCASPAYYAPDSPVYTRDGASTPPTASTPTYGATAAPLLTPPPIQRTMTTSAGVDDDDEQVTPQARE